MATHFSILVCEDPWIEKPSGLQYTGLQRVRHDWAHMSTLLQGTLLTSSQPLLFYIWNASSYASRFFSPSRKGCHVAKGLLSGVSNEKRKKKNEWTWVSSSTCREIGSQPFILKTSKKLNRWKTQQLSLDHKRRENTGQAIAAKTGEIYRWIQRITITTHHRNQCQVGKLDLR